jgi:hypothetical protein
LLIFVFLVGAVTLLCFQISPLSIQFDPQGGLIGPWYLLPP